MVAFDTLREHRWSAIAWIVGGALANYWMIFSLKNELEDFPGGPEMLVKVLGPTIEAFRPMRWPAERLDTLGGYATYHNMLLITMFLGVYAALQGATSLRTLEANGSMSVWLSAGISRRHIVIVRSVSFALMLGAIAMGIAGGTALALSGAGEPNIQGAFITLLASWCVSLLCFGFGQLLSHFLSSAKLAAGIAATTIVVLYVLGNSAGTFGPFAFLEYLSPFTYSNMSRALVPGIDAHWPSMIGVVFAAAALIAVSTRLFLTRDIGSVVRARVHESHQHVASRRSFTVRSLFGDGLYHSWVAMLTWALGGAALVGVMVSLEPAAMDAWSYFDVLFPPGQDAIVEREAQYLSFSGALLVPLVAGFVVAQSSKWSADFTAGRTGLILSTPVSWARLFSTRAAIALLGVVGILVASLGAMVIVAASIDVGVDLDGLIRLTTSSLVLGVAMIALSAIVTVLFTQRSAVLMLSIYLAVSYILLYVAPMLEWPPWVGRLSLFTAFGNPYIEWPTLLESSVILALAGPGLLLAFVLTTRSRKAL